MGEHTGVSEKGDEVAFHVGHVRAVALHQLMVVRGVSAPGCRVQGAGFRVQGSGCRVQGSGFRVQGRGSRVEGSGARVAGSGSRDRCISW